MVKVELLLPERTLGERSSAEVAACGVVEPDIGYVGTTARGVVVDSLSCE